MSAAQEIKIVFAGPMGAGKTTAIRALSDHPPVCTEIANTERKQGTKETTAVALGPAQPFVVGVGRLPVACGPELDRLAARDIPVPVFGVDVRNREDVLLLVETLLCILETRTAEPLDGIH